MLLHPNAGGPAYGEAIVIEDRWLGKITVPPGDMVSVWAFPRCLDKDANDKVKKAVTAALDDDEKSALALERSLPLVHSLLRDGLREHPTAKGAPRLRLILTLFDDVVQGVPVGPARNPEGAAR
jgi:hypothetical protein